MGTEVIRMPNLAQHRMPIIFRLLYISAFFMNRSGLKHRGRGASAFMSDSNASPASAEVKAVSRRVFDRR